MGKLLFCFAVLLLVGQKTFGYDINELRERALKHVEENMEYLRQTLNHTVTDLPFRKQNLQDIVKHEKSVGDNLVESTYIDVHKARVTGEMLATLKSSYPFVLECIQNAERSSIADLDSYHADRFLKPVASYKDEAEKIQDDDIRKWTDEYNNEALKFSELYEGTVRNIINSQAEEEIAWLVRQFDNTCRDFYTIITRINTYLADIQYELLVILEKLVDSLRGFVRTEFDTTQMAMRDCFNQFNVPNTRSNKVNLKIVTL